MMCLNGKINMVRTLRLAGLLAAGFFCVVSSMSAQDIHFSQFHRSPLNLNPGYAGYFDGDYRFSGIHRNQWKSVTTPFKTFSGSFDMNMPFPGSDRSRLGTGIVFNTDKAGDSEYGITQAMLSSSWIHAAGGDSIHFFSAGIQAGFTQHTINYSNLTFDSQFNGDVFDPSLPSNEIFSRDKLFYFDFSLGFSYLYVSGERFNIGGGISLQHLFEPKIDFISDASEAKTNRKVAADIHSSIGLTENIYLQPGLLFATQKKFSELNFGGNLKLLLNRKPGKILNLYAGLFLRTSDAIIPTIGLDFNDLHFGLSYDINTSDLKRASNSRGGYEVSLTYIIKKVKPLGIRPPCPVY